MIRSYLLLVIGLLAFASCRKEKSVDSKRNSTLKYAKGFTTKPIGSSTEVEILEPFPQAGKSIKYLLVPKNEKIPDHDERVQIIRTPVEKIVCTSTSHVALLDHLGAIDKLIGFPSTDLISSVAARQRVDAGKIEDLGIDKEMNLEMLIALQPELVMGYSMAGDMIKLDKVRNLGIPVVINGEYLEDHPLGRAEWIKFMALFLDKEDSADSIFNAIESEYLTSQSMVSAISSRPTVISGILYGDAWFLPGGQNYAAKIFNDAGYHYLWNEDPSNGWLKLSFESVYAIGKDADYWIGVASFLTKTEMKSAEKRYSLFQSFETSNVYTYDARRGPKGGSEYFELGYSRPDIILKDLIKIAHPDLLPDHSLFFYKKLE